MGKQVTAVKQCLLYFIINLYPLSSLCLQIYNYIFILRTKSDKFFEMWK